MSCLTNKCSSLMLYSYKIAFALLQMQLLCLATILPHIINDEFSFDTEVNIFSSIYIEGFETAVKTVALVVFASMLYQIFRGS